MAFTFYLGSRLKMASALSGESPPPAKKLRKIADFEAQIADKDAQCASESSPKNFINSRKISGKFYAPFLRSRQIFGAFLSENSRWRPGRARAAASAILAACQQKQSKKRREFSSKRDGHQAIAW